MRVVVQRVREASVRVGGDTVGEIGAGLCCLVGVTHSDTDRDASWLAGKLAKLRIFPDDQGRMNRSALDTGGQILVVSQFTLMGDAKKGNRPSFVQAASPDQAEPLIECLVAELRAADLSVETGMFRADMLVSLVNDGPVTILLDSAVK